MYSKITNGKFLFFILFWGYGASYTNLEKVHLTYEVSNFLFNEVVYKKTWKVLIMSKIFLDIFGLQFFRQLWVSDLIITYIFFSLKTIFPFVNFFIHNTYVRITNIQNISDDLFICLDIFCFPYFFLFDIRSFP